MIEKIFKILSGRFVFLLSFLFIFGNLHFCYSKPTLDLESYYIFKVDVISKYAVAWKYLSTIYILASFTFITLIADYIYRNLLQSFISKKRKEDLDEIRPPPYPYDPDKLQMIIGLKHKRNSLDLVHDPTWLIVPEKGMYQNFLITGTIGTGKTASAMYPFTKQAMFYKPDDPKLKSGMLVLDVKGNFYKQVLKFAEEAGRLDDVVIIELGGKYKFNPMHKPLLRPLVLANRCKVVLSLFSPKGASDGFWLDKAELLIAECIKLSRLYLNDYVTFVEINKLVNSKTYLDKKINDLIEEKECYMLTNSEEDEFETCLDYFQNEYKNLSENTLSIIQSVVTQMTQFFYTDPEIRSSFSPLKEELNFYGFKEVIDQGKIVILKMNIAQYRNVAKTISAYMKLDFQSEVLQRLVRDGANIDRPIFFIADEYHEFATSTDAEFYAQSRESKCINIVATQSYTSLIQSLKDRDLVRTITQNCINKIWLRTDDTFTWEEAQKQSGKEDKEKISKSISENSGDVKKSRILGTLVSEKASVSESINISTSREFCFDEKLFTQKLNVFKSICFLSDGEQILEPTVVHLQPYFSEVINQIKRLLPNENFLNTKPQKESEKLDVPRTEPTKIENTESQNSVGNEQRPISKSFEKEKSEITQKQIIKQISKNERRINNESNPESKQNGDSKQKENPVQRSIDDLI